MDAAQTVLVTGGTGYLASWVVAGLLERGHRVRTTVRDTAKARVVRAAVAEQVGDAASGIEFFVADLLSADGWAQAVAGADGVIHTASPLGTAAGADPIRPAREGVRHVLNAAGDAGVRRVVVTSSGVAAIIDGQATPNDETQWAPVTGRPTDAYRDSKILAERDAWAIADDRGLDLTTVLPTFIQGPMLGAPSAHGSTGIIEALLSGSMPAVPKIGWDIVDVRDLARLHLEALFSAEAVGERILGAGGFAWWIDVARYLREGLPTEIARRVPSRTMPDLMVRAAAKFNPQLALLAPSLGRTALVDASKAERLLGWRSRPTAETVTDTAAALLAKASRPADAA